VTPPQVVVLATGNAGKAREFARLLGGAFAVRTMPPSVALPPETGRTFAENARVKAEAVFAALGGLDTVLADDSGLEVAALEGRPGVFSARYAGEDAADEDNVRRLLGDLLGKPDRQARFVCALCLVLPEKSTGGGERRVIEVQGLLDGAITLFPRGAAGFGYDPVFQPQGWAVTLAETSAAEKDRVSHRGTAVQALLARLAAEGLVQYGS